MYYLYIIIKQTKATMVTSNSTPEEKQDALSKCIIAIEALKLVQSVGLGTGNIENAIEDLKIFEKQLINYLTK